MLYLAGIRGPLIIIIHFIERLVIIQGLLVLRALPPNQTLYANREDP